MENRDQSELIAQVRDALAHLYDLAYLQRHPLAELLVEPGAALIRPRGQELRRILLDAIEALNPGDAVPMRAPERRPYVILFGLYVEGRAQPEVASDLGIGTRQLRRDRSTALEALAGVLQDRCPSARREPGPSAASEPLQRESERLAAGREPLDLQEVVQGLLPLLQGVAQDRGVRLETRIDGRLPRPAANRTLVRQVLIGLASQALSTLPLTALAFEARSGPAAAGVGLELELRPEGVSAGGEPLVPRLQAQSVATLVSALGASLLQETLSARKERVWLLLPLEEETTVLVVDDNQELFALFARYVAGRPYRLTHAGSAEQALALVRAQRPQVITIDLMMPGLDGWELLQALRDDPATAAIPAIICSVLEEPQLALSLGARAYLKKPVGQADLLQALEAAKAQAWSEEESRGSPAGS